MKNCDIFLGQEILLLKEDVSFLDGIDDQFDNFVVPSAPTESNYFEGRSQGGLVLFWHKSLNLYVHIISAEKNYLAASMRYHDFSMCLINIYIYALR